uniref:Oxidored_FMN domain-containing protein n=1 Tax=Rhabditophanes sp. KR3021 TaxID=114890 RepID=A0AC35TJR9_9BILA
MFDRLPVKETTNCQILGEQIVFEHAGIVANNRFIKAPLTELKAFYNKNNLITHAAPNDKLINIYSKWGNGFFGLIITGNNLVDENHIEGHGNVIIEQEWDSIERRQQFKKLAIAAKSDGALLIGQLNHCGKKTTFQYNEAPKSSSSKQHLDLYDTTSKFGQPVPLEINEIKEVINKYAYAANFLYKCGYDGVEIHSTFEFLLASFISPNINDRNDEYGGTFENRSRLLREIYEAIRCKVNNRKFLVGLKISPFDFVNEANSVDDALELSVMVEDLGFDYVQLSGGFHEKWEIDVECQANISDYSTKFANAFKSNLHKTKIFSVGGYRTVKRMVDAVKEDNFDGISIGRPITQEPNLPKNILDNQVQSTSIHQSNECNFLLAMKMCWVQLEGMGLRHFDKTDNNPCADIPDYSKKEIADKILKAL